VKDQHGDSEVTMLMTGRDALVSIVFTDAAGRRFDVAVSKRDAYLLGSRLRDAAKRVEGE
jgi:hypothetical protein